MKYKRFNTKIHISGKEHQLGYFHTAQEAGIMFAKAKVYRDNMKANKLTTESKKPALKSL